MRDRFKAEDKESSFSKDYSKNWFYKQYRTTESPIDTITAYQINNFAESYKEALLRKTEVIMELKKKTTFKVLEFNLNKDMYSSSTKKHVKKVLDIYVFNFFGICCRFQGFSPRKF